MANRGRSIYFNMLKYLPGRAAPTPIISHLPAVVKYYFLSNFQALPTACARVPSATPVRPKAAAIELHLAAAAGIQIFYAAAPCQILK